LIAIVPGHDWRIHLRSSQTKADCASAAVTSIKGIGPWPGTTMFGRAGTPPSRRNEANQPGRSAICAAKGILCRSEPGGELLHAVAVIALAQASPPACRS
jgi:hypothetical protein